MGAWARILALWSVFLLSRLHAQDESAVAKEEPESDHTDAEWEELKKNIMDSLPDDEEEEGKEEEEHDGLDEDHIRWHITEGYPFIEYHGFLDNDPSKDDASMNLHSGTMTLEEAKTWCAKSEKCVGFDHAGEPGDGPFEFRFKDHWQLNVESEDPWVSYQKGEKLPDEEIASLAEPVSVSAEEVMEEYGMGEDNKDKKEL